jgi:hypothetical protein
MKTRVRKAIVLVNTFGAVGYLLLLLCVVFFVAALAWLFLQSSAIPLSGEEIVTPGAYDGPSQISPVGMSIAYIAAGIVAFLSLLLVILFPYFIGKWCAKIVRHLMKSLRIPLTRRNAFLTKGMLAMIPLVGFIGLNIVYEAPDITIPTLHIAAIVTSLLSIGCFLLQVYISRSLNVSVRDSW